MRFVERRPFADPHVVGKNPVPNSSGAGLLQKCARRIGPPAPLAQPLELRPAAVAIFGKMRWRAISIIAAGAMIALSVFVFRPHPHDRGIRPPYAELISKQCAVAPENDPIPAEYSCQKR
jgi:hypothetical protein